MGKRLGFVSSSGKVSFRKPKNANKADSSGNFPAGFEAFALIEDPRTIAADIIAKGGDRILSVKGNQ